MQGIRRQRRGAQAWRALLAQFAGSGLTVAAFCRRESVGTASFYRWRSQLAPASASAITVRSPVAQAAPHATADFVDLGPLLTTASAPAHFELRLDLGGGLVLQLRRG